MVNLIENDPKPVTVDRSRLGGIPTPRPKLSPGLDRMCFPSLGFRSCSQEVQQQSARARPLWLRISPGFSATKPITKRPPGPAGVRSSVLRSCSCFFHALSPRLRNGRAFAVPMGRVSARRPTSPSNGLPMTTIGRSTCRSWAAVHQYYGVSGSISWVTILTVSNAVFSASTQRADGFFGGAIIR